MFFAIAIAAIAFALLAHIVQVLVGLNQQGETDRRELTAQVKKLGDENVRLKAKLKELSLVADIWSGLPRRIDSTREIAITLGNEAITMLQAHPQIVWQLKTLDEYLTRLGKAHGADYNGAKWTEFRPAITASAAFGPLEHLIKSTTHATTGSAMEVPEAMNDDAPVAQEDFAAEAAAEMMRESASSTSHETMSNTTPLSANVGEPLLRAV